MDAEYILGISDPHCGDYYGLLNPITKLREDGQDGQPVYKAPDRSAYSAFYWDEIYTKALPYFYSMIGDAPVTYFICGDATQGMRHIQRVYTPLHNEQVEIAKDVIQYACGQLNIKRIFLASGTEDHVGLDGDNESSVAKALDHPNRPVIATPLARISVGGGDVQLAHHGYYVGEGHLRGNSGRLMLQRRMVEDMLLLGKRPACLHLSGHWHKYVHITHIETIGGEDIESHAIVLPAVTAMNGYARKQTRSAPIVWTGLALIKIENGRVQWVNRDYIVPIDIRENWGFEPGKTPGVMAFHWRGHSVN